MNRRWFKEANEQYGDRFPSEEHVTNEDLHRIFGDTKFLASKYRLFNRGAADFHRMGSDDMLNHFNDHIVPLWQKHGLPIPGKEPYGPFQDEILDRWREVQ